MPSDERRLAWNEPRGDGYLGAFLAWIKPRGGGYLAAFVAKAELERRAPAIQQFRSQDEARQWVMKEAETVGARVEWLAAGTLLDRLPH